MNRHSFESRIMSAATMTAERPGATIVLAKAAPTAEGSP
jgi:hypothetical protein